MSHPSRARAAAAPTALKSRQPLLQATLGVFRKSTPAPKPWVRPRAPIILSTTHRRRDRASVRPILKRQTSRRRRDSDVSETSTLRGDADELELELEPMYQKQGVRGVDYYEVLVRTSGLKRSRFSSKMKEITCRQRRAFPHLPSPEINEVAVKTTLAPSPNRKPARVDWGDHRSGVRFVVVEKA